MAEATDRSAGSQADRMTTCHFPGRARSQRGASFPAARSDTLSILRAFTLQSLSHT
jgi:hypothetical protein